MWSRRNGPWRPVRILWVGAAPGNAGGLGSSDLGAHGTRIPFGGDVAGANLDVLLSSIGITRNDTFIVASLNQLPARGGGEPTTAELNAPVGAYPDSIALLRDTIVACRPELVIALGNVALRTTAAAVSRAYDAPVGAPAPCTPAKLPTLARIAATGVTRDVAAAWPDTFPFDETFVQAWRDEWDAEPRLHVLPVMHPSAQNMSPFARRDTLFHERMLHARDAVVCAARDVLSIRPPARRPQPPHDGIYALPEWRERIAGRHARLDELWREHGV